jgi:branched-chain amino acid transport system ATP-binding protein
VSEQAAQSPAAQTEPAATAQPTLHLRELTIARAGRAVVRDVTIEIPPGEVTALLGPNGAGKSSLVLGVAGVLRPTSGSVLLGDQELTGRRPEKVRQAGVAVVPEGRRLLSQMTVDENLQVATYMLSREEGKARREYALELFPELRERLGFLTRSLSGGQQQMVVLAQALVSQPKFVLIDELSLGLAPVVVRRLIPTIRAVAQSGVGVLLIEQFAAVALDLAQRAYVMDRGSIRFSGLASELKAKPELLQTAYLPGGDSGVAAS